MLQTVDDPLQIKAAAGAFGLLGVVTHITFELDAMTYAVMVGPFAGFVRLATNPCQKPLKEDVGLGVPPLDKNDIPEALRSEWFAAPDVDQRLLSATEAFKQRAENDYYSE